MLNFKIAKMVMNEKDKENFRLSNKGYNCGSSFSSKKDKCRKHCHITGKCCDNCNKHIKLMKRPVIFHNLRSYDSHHLMLRLGEFKKKISVILNDMEKYRSFTVENLRFIDSLHSSIYVFESWKVTKKFED